MGVKDTSSLYDQPCSRYRQLETTKCNGISMGYLSPCSAPGHLGVTWCKWLKMACNLKTNGRGVKRREKSHIETFNHLEVNVLLGSRNALITKWPVTRQRLILE